MMPDTAAHHSQSPGNSSVQLTSVANTPDEHSQDQLVLDTIETHLSAWRLEEAVVCVSHEATVVRRHTLRLLDAAFTRLVEACERGAILDEWLAEIVCSPHETDSSHDKSVGSVQESVEDSDETTSSSAVDSVSCRVRSSVRLLCAICRRANGKEALVCLLEKVAMCGENDVCFCSLIEPLQCVLLAQANTALAHDKYLYWVANSLYSRLASLSTSAGDVAKSHLESTSSCTPAKHRAIKNNNNNNSSGVSRAVLLLARFIHFLRPFVDRVALTADATISCSQSDTAVSLSRSRHVLFLLRCCRRPLLFLDVRRGVTERRVAGRVMCSVSQLVSDYVVRLLPLLSGQPSDGSLPIPSGDEQHELDHSDDSEGAWSPGRYSLCVAAFLHLLLAEQLGLASTPMVHHASYLVRRCLSAALLLLQARDTLVMDKGCHLTKVLLDRLCEESLEAEHLDDPVFVRVCEALFNVAVFGGAANGGAASGGVGVETRRGCVDQVTRLLSRFKLRARHRLLLQLINGNLSSSVTVLAYLTDQVRSNVALALARYDRRSLTGKKQDSCAVEQENQHQPAESLSEDKIQDCSRLDSRGGFKQKARVNSSKLTDSCSLEGSSSIADLASSSSRVNLIDDEDDEGWFLSPRVDRLVECCCLLPDEGVHCDLLENRTHITAALSLLRFLCLSARARNTPPANDSTSVCVVINARVLIVRLRDDFLDRLHEALRISRLRFQQRLKDLSGDKQRGITREGDFLPGDTPQGDVQAEQAGNMSLSVLNDPAIQQHYADADGGPGSRALSRDQELDTAKLALTTLDFMTNALSWLEQAILDLN